MFNKIVKEFKWGQHNVRLETGEIARQASGAVLVDVEDTVVLSLLSSVRRPRSRVRTFSPLTVDYLEKTYSPARFRAVFSAAKAVRRKAKR